MAGTKVACMPTIKCDEDVDQEIAEATRAANIRQQCFRPNSALGGSSLFVQPAIESDILRSLSSSPLEGMSTRNRSDSSTIQNSEGSFGVVTSNTNSAETNPRRNLMEAFEELHINKPSKSTSSSETPQQSDSKTMKASNSNMISPTGAAEFPGNGDVGSPDDDESPTTPTTTKQIDASVKSGEFELHTDLQKDMTEALVHRVSIYSVIHDINKEATAMASNDDSDYSRIPDEAQEPFDPLVVAVNGFPQDPLTKTSSFLKVALIDEEVWLLEAIDARDEDETSSTVNACPPTFLQAMGERDYENPVVSLSNGSRTQLWKPSRSWWEAKSGKNPWIEPKSHNRRWRYLWPLIHYHKFLARCIKKLKRNGVDVKTSLSPVSVFLREEVCAVSDHLAAVSLFDSDQWMQCLKHFHGWTATDSNSEESIRQLISTLKLRSLTEPGDIDSPLLRTQIDENYLRAMAVAREQMVSGADSERRSQNDSHPHRQKNSDMKQGKSNHSSRGHPPAYPRGGAPTSAKKVPAGITAYTPSGMRRPRWGYPPQGWNYGYHPHYGYGDDLSSIQSGLSGDSSYPQHHEGMPPMMSHAHPQYYDQMMYHQQHLAHQQMYDPNLYHDPAAMYTPNENYGEGDQMAPWMGPPGMNQVHPDSPAPLETPVQSDPLADTSTQSSEEPQVPREETPHKYNPHHVNQMPVSPYWGHLDPSQVAMMALATPQGPATPQTPTRGSAPGQPEDPASSSTPQHGAAAMNVQPLLLRQQYYGYGYGNAEAFPPSPATQFMMSPQANFTYNYGYGGGFSPSRSNARNRRNSSSPTEKKENDVGQQSVSVTPIRSTSKRESPVTVATATESESQC